MPCTEGHPNKVCSEIQRKVSSPQGSSCASPALFGFGPMVLPGYPGCPNGQASGPPHTHE